MNSLLTMTVFAKCNVIIITTYIYCFLRQIVIVWVNKILGTKWVEKVKHLR